MPSLSPPRTRTAAGLGSAVIIIPALAEQAPAPPSERLTSAAGVWALASAERLGLLRDIKVLDQAVAHLSQEFARLSGNDLETRAALLHALSARHGRPSRRPTA